MIVVREHDSPEYRPRTKYNADSADLTLAFAVNFNTGGERLTRKLAKHICSIPLTYCNVPGIRENTINDAVRQIVDKLTELNGCVLNIAGNGIYNLVPVGISQDDVTMFIYDILMRVEAQHEILYIHTGGQTGADIGGASAAYALGIPVEVTLPKGYIQRHEDKIDRPHTREDIERQIVDGAIVCRV